MKFIIAIIFCLIIHTITGTAIDNTDQEEAIINPERKLPTLVHVFDVMRQSKGAGLEKSLVLIKMFNNTDFECIKRGLNFEKFGDKQVSRNVIDKAIIPLMYRCLPDNIKYEIFANSIGENLKDSRKSQCSKIYLQQIDPTSKMLDDFDIDSVDDLTLGICNSRINGHADVTKILNKFTVESCEDIVLPKTRKLWVILTNLLEEENDQIRWLEFNRMMEFVDPKIDELVACNLEIM